jgi:phosphatidylserine decarboxylase
LRGPAYRAFARATGADLGEAELALGAYPSLGEFFARRLRAGVRTVEADARAVIAPCDGAAAACGIAEDGVLVQAKGHTYTIEELVVDDVRAAALAGGTYATIYLAPRDYHRVHAPVDARIVGYDHVPGALWPVNPRVAARRDRLFARNERVVIWLELAPGRPLAAVVMVGATGVGFIELEHADTRAWRHDRELRRVELGGVRVRRGEELGAFRLGSTVVVLFPPGALAGDLAVHDGDLVRMGQKLAVASGQGDVRDRSERSERRPL